MNVTCPNCGFEEAYFNGVAYECPDCGHIWNDKYDDEDEF